MNHSKLLDAWVLIVPMKPTRPVHIFPSLHIIEVDETGGHEDHNRSFYVRSAKSKQKHTFFYVDSQHLLRQYVGGREWSFQQVEIGEPVLPIAPQSELTGCIVAAATFVLFFENTSGELKGLRLQQGKSNLLSPISISTEPDSAFMAISGMDGTINVFYQHRDKYLHRLLIDPAIWHSRADIALTNSGFDQSLIHIAIKEGKDGRFRAYARVIDQERQALLDEMFKDQPDQFNGEQPAAASFLVGVGADGKRIELEGEPLYIDPDTMTMPISFQSSLIPRQPGAAATTTRAA